MTKMMRCQTNAFPSRRDFTLIIILSLVVFECEGQTRKRSILCIRCQDVGGSFVGANISSMFRTRTCKEWEAAEDEDQRDQEYVRHCKKDNAVEDNNGCFSLTADLFTGNASDGTGRRVSLRNCFVIAVNASYDSLMPKSGCRSETTDEPEKLNAAENMWNSLYKTGTPTDAITKVKVQSCFCKKSYCNGGRTIKANYGVWVGIGAIMIMQYLFLFMF